VILLAIAVAAAAAVLLGAGVAKLLQPAGTAAVLAALGVPSPATAARVLGTGEVVLGAATLVVAGPILSGLVALTYAGAAATVVAARRAGLGTCGCFGARSPAPRPLHAAVDLGCAAAAAVGAIVGVEPLAEAISGRSTAEATAVVAGTIALAALVVLASTAPARQVR